MKFKVLGIQRHVNWTYNGSSGVNQRLHVVNIEQMKNQNPDDDNEGRRVEVVKVPLRIDLSGIHPNDDVSIFYNRFGQVDQIERVK